MPYERKRAIHAPGGYQKSRKNADSLVRDATQYNACRSRRALEESKDPEVGNWHFGVEDT